MTTFRIYGFNSSVCFCAVFVLSCLCASQFTAATPLTALTVGVDGWVNVTNNVGGDHWGPYGVTYMKAVPASCEVIAGVSECGLWSSTDDGATWNKLGGNEIKNRPGRIVFDPKGAKTFWESGCYADAPFVTHDGGRTFQRLGNLAHADGIAIDFTDKQRMTLLLGMHEQSQSLQMSTDGGATWKLIGDRLPANSNHSSDPIILDSKTFLINTAGWKQNATLGIYRSTDAGATWSQVATFGPAGEPLIASDGSIYWQRLWGGGLLRSVDKGNTWQQVSNAVKSNVVEFPGGRLAGTNGNQLVVSADSGVTWTAFGPPIPFNPNGITYSAKDDCFFAWQLSDNMTKQMESIVRLRVR